MPSPTLLRWHAAALSLCVFASGCEFNPLSLISNQTVTRDGDHLVVEIDDTPKTVGSGKVASETRELAGFTALSVTHGIDIDLIEGDEPSFTVMADDNLLPLVVARTEPDGELRLELSAGVDTRNPIAVEIVGASIDRVQVSSSARFNAESIHTDNPTFSAGSRGRIKVASIEASGLQAEASSSSSIELSNVATTSASLRASSSAKLTVGSIEAERVKTHSSSSGSLKIAGHAETLEAHVSSSGRLRAEELQAQTVRIKASSSGDANLGAVGALSGSASSSGSVGYQSADKVNVGTSSSGRVSKR